MDRADKSQGHVIISGTGRSGTTLLVQILSHLGFDTGFTAADSLLKVSAVSHAGLEHNAVTHPTWPYVVKSPLASFKLGGLVAAGKIRVRLVIVPMRPLQQVVESRKRVADLGETRGGAWVRPRETAQQTLLAAMHALFVAIAEHGLPHLLIAFPRFARDEEYAFAQLQPLLAPHGVTRAEFAAAFAACVRQERIHEFPEAPTQG